MLKAPLTAFIIVIAASSPSAFAAECSNGLCGSIQIVPNYPPPSNPPSVIESRVPPKAPPSTITLPGDPGNHGGSNDPISVPAR
jgi:hypothetical protein